MLVCHDQIQDQDMPACLNDQIENEDHDVEISACYDQDQNENEN